MVFINSGAIARDVECAFRLECCELFLRLITSDCFDMRLTKYYYLYP